MKNLSQNPKQTPENYFSHQQRLLDLTNDLNQFTARNGFSASLRPAISMLRSLRKTIFVLNFIHVWVYFLFLRTLLTLHFLVDYIFVGTSLILFWK